MSKIELWLNLYRSLLDPHRFEASVHPSKDLAERSRNWHSCHPEPIKLEVEVEPTTEPGKWLDSDD